jgi:hypothetical protein
MRSVSRDESPNVDETSHPGSAKYISIPVSGGVDPDGIRVYDVASGKPRSAVHFATPLGMLFRAAWVDGDAHSSAIDNRLFPAS